MFVQSIVLAPLRWQSHQRKNLFVVDFPTPVLPRALQTPGQSQQIVPKQTGEQRQRDDGDAAFGGNQMHRGHFFLKNQEAQRQEGEKQNQAHLTILEQFPGTQVQDSRSFQCDIPEGDAHQSI